jgi:hypothetical protein
MRQNNARNMPAGIREENGVFGVMAGFLALDKGVKTRQSPAAKPPFACFVRN